MTVYLLCVPPRTILMTFLFSTVNKIIMYGKMKTMYIYRNKEKKHIMKQFLQKMICSFPPGGGEWLFGWYGVMSELLSSVALLLPALVTLLWRRDLVSGLSPSSKLTTFATFFFFFFSFFFTAGTLEDSLICGKRMLTFRYPWKRKTFVTYPRFFCKVLPKPATC